MLLRAAVRDAEACHHLVEDEQRAVVVAELAQPREEGLVRHDEARVAHDALEDDTGDLALVRLEECLDGLEVVVRRHQRRLRCAHGDARRIRQPKRRDARARRHQESVGVPVVAAVELDDLFALGVRAHQPQHAHARLGARVGEAHHLDRRHRVDHHLGELVLERAGRTEGRALVHRLLDRSEHTVVRVTHDRWAPRADVVHVLVPVDIVRLAALSAVEDDGFTAHRLEGAHRRGDTARHDRPCLRHDLGGLCSREARRRDHAHDRLLRLLLLHKVRTASGEE